MGRRLGQHFLKSQRYLHRIADTVAAEGTDLVVEIGPGRGALTALLLERASHVVAVEIDTRLVEHLRERFDGSRGLEVIESDVLGVDLGQWGPAVVAGNLPYYVTSPIVERVLQMGARLHRAVFLVQEELADRLTAEPGSRDYGFLTVRTRLAAEVEKLFRVPPSAFQPPPKVDSALVSLTPLPGPARDPKLIEFVGRCFRYKRKTLRNNLAGAYDAARIDALPEASLRAEQIPVEAFADLYRRLESASLY